MTNFEISTHAPHTRRDSEGLLPEGLLSNFYSRASYEARPYGLWGTEEAFAFLLTRLIRGATISPSEYSAIKNFYSRASYEARLSQSAVDTLIFLDFYSRASYEARRQMEVLKIFRCLFLLTRLIRGATLLSLFFSFLILIFLLTRLIRGATDSAASLIRRMENFYSRASYEARRYLARQAVSWTEFLLTRLIRGAT